MISALAGPEDLIVSDALDHASIVDGARLARARVAVVPHLDLAAFDRALSEHRRRRAFAITESYFSMDADSPDLRELRRVCDARGAGLVVDESHALGVLGPDGRGLCAAAGVEPDALVGTFGKAFGAGGRSWRGARRWSPGSGIGRGSFVFSTGLSPAVASAALRASGSRAEPIGASERLPPPGSSARVC